MFDFPVIAQLNPIIKMAKTNVHTVHTHSHSDTHMHRNSLASSGHRWSLLLITGLELSSQVLPEKEKKTTQKHNGLQLKVTMFIIHLRSGLGFWEKLLFAFLSRIRLNRED